MIHDIPAQRVTMPSRRLTDPSFDYVPSCKTDVRVTIAKARERIKAARLLPVPYKGVTNG
jgi:hypothetical protein